MSDGINRKPDQPGHLLGALLLGTVIALAGAALIFGMSRPSLGPILMGLSLIVLAAMFLVSYYAPHKSVVLRWLIQFSQGFPGYKNAKIALLLALICALTGLKAVMDGLGI